MGDSAHTHAAMPHQSEAAHAARSVLQRAWWLALGLLTTVGEQTTRVAEAMVEKGRAVEPRVTEPMKRAASGFPGAAAGGVAAGVRRAASTIANRARAGTRPQPPASRSAPSAPPTAEEFQRLAEEVRELRARLMEREGR